MALTTKHILAGVNLNQTRTIKEHNDLIVQAIDELIDYIIITNDKNEFNQLDFKNNITTLKHTYEILERKLLV